MLSRSRLKDIATTFLGSLLCREELVGSFSEANVKKALREWIPADKFP